MNMGGSSEYSGQINKSKPKWNLQAGEHWTSVIAKPKSRGNPYGLWIATLCSQ
jgi:hypothetical protein